MTLVNFFLRKKTLITANIAKERLKILVNKRSNLESYFCPQFKQDLLEVIQKYVHNPQLISIQTHKKDQHTFKLKLYIVFSKKLENT